MGKRKMKKTKKKPWSLQVHQVQQQSTHIDPGFLLSRWVVTRISLSIFSGQLVSLLLGRPKLCGQVCTLVLLLSYWWLLAGKTQLASRSLLQPYQSSTSCCWLCVAKVVWVASPWKVKWLLYLSGEEVGKGHLKVLLLCQRWQTCLSFLWIFFLHFFSLAYNLLCSRRKLK